MTPDDAELELLVAADEEERDRLVAELGVDAEGSEGEEVAGFAQRSALQRAPRACSRV